MMSAAHTWFGRSIAELCLPEGIAEILSYVWPKEFMEVGKKRLTRDAEHQASSGEVKDLRQETGGLKALVADLTIENRLLRKALSAVGATANEIPRVGEARDRPAGRGISAAGEAHA
jgi:hypothetical protein